VVDVDLDESELTGVDSDPTDVEVVDATLNVVDVAGGVEPGGEAIVVEVEVDGPAVVAVVLDGANVVDVVDVVGVVEVVEVDEVTVVVAVVDVVVAGTSATVSCH
jgi:hypothetical protein